MVRVVTESTADLPDELAKALEIEVVATHVIFGTETYRDGVDLTREAFYGKLASSRTIPTTAAPPPSAYERVYRRLAAETDGVVSIHTASSLSGLYNSASVAAASVPETRIAVVDSEQVTMGCGWMAVAAAEAARRGDSLERIIALVESLKRRTYVLAVLDNLQFAHRGGRVGWIGAMLGTLVQVKPLVEVRLGEVRLVERTRSWKRSLERLTERVRNLGPIERAIVLHANAVEAAERMADQLQALQPGWKRLIGQAGVTIASHAGPGAVGLAFVTKS